MEFDLTKIIVELIGAFGAITAAVFVALINRNVKDNALRQQLVNAAKNSVGAIEEAGKHGIELLKPHVEIPGIPEKLQPGVQYVLDHAGEGVKRFGLSNEAIADKVVAQIGLARINSPVAAQLPPPAVVAPAKPKPARQVKPIAAPPVAHRRPGRPKKAKA